MMTRTLAVVCLILGIVCLGCPAAEGPRETSEPTPVQPPGADPAAEMEAAPETGPDVEATESPSEPEAAVAAPEYSEEQIAAAKQTASDLGVVVKEDAEGNVVLLDTAAKRSWVDDSQMLEILVFPGLRSLTVEGPGITDALAERIGEQTSLESLALRNTLVGDKGIAQFKELKSLRVIDLRVSPLVTDAAMETLLALSELRAVRLTGGNVTDAGVATLLDLPRLTELDVRNCRGVTKSGIEQLVGKKTLRVLKIGGPKIDDDVLEVVGRMENLTGLSLDNCNVTDAGVAKLSGLPLASFTIYQSSAVTDQGLEVLAAYEGLEHLTLRDVPAKGLVLAKLVHPEKLLSLNMAQSGITDAEVVHLARMTALDSLNLSETALTDAVVDVLSKLASLRELVLTQTGISSEGMERLEKALPDCLLRSN